MSYNGSGTFNINSAGQPVVTGTTITSTAFNLLTADLATGLSTAMTKDGQSTPTANIPMGTFKLTGLGAGTAATDAAQYGQLQAGATTIAVVTGTDTLAGTLTPAITAYATGNLFSFVAANTNTGAATIALNGLAAKNITKTGTTALAAGDIVSGRVYLIEYDGTRFQLLNPSASSVASFSAGSTGFTPSTATTGAVTLAGTLATTNGGTGLTSFTANGVVYASSTSALATGSALTFDGTTITNTASASSALAVTGKSLVFYNTSTSDALLRAADDASTVTAIGFNKTDVKVYSSGSEVGRFNATGFGIGTSTIPTVGSTTVLAVGNSSGGTLGIVQSGSIAYRISASTSGVDCYNPNSSPISWYTAGTSRLTLDAAGNFGVGVTPQARLNVQYADSAPTASGTISSGVLFQYSTGGVALNLGSSSGGYVYFNSAYANNAGVGAAYRWYQGATQAMTLDASNNLLVGTTSALAGSNARLQVDGGTTYGQIIKSGGVAANANTTLWHVATTGNNVFCEFGTEASFTSRGSITYNRGAGLVAYNVTSDYRSKDIIGPVIDSGALIDSVPVYMGKMKGATQERPMFIAHETPAYAHTGEKDAVDADGNPVYQQMDASALIPVMWAEIQSLRKRLADAGI